MPDLVVAAVVMVVRNDAVLWLIGRVSWCFRQAGADKPAMSIGDPELGQSSKMACGAVHGGTLNKSACTLPCRWGRHKEAHQRKKHDVIDDLDRF